MKIGRREILVGGALFLSLATQAPARDDPVGSESSRFPRSPFSKNSTAEEVTAGLDLRDKTALVTGCTSGIGFETLRVLVLRGARVFGLGRTLESARRACEAVNRAGASGKAIPFACEHTDWSSVVKCAEAVRAQATPIDMLICNAGIFLLPTLELAQGLEKQFVVNHLAHFILVHHLIEQVKAAPQGRIVMVSSNAYMAAPEGGIEFDNLDGQRYYDPLKAYAQSKLANGLFARELTRRLSGTAVTANSLNPGIVLTDAAVRTLTSQDAAFDTQKALQTGAKTPEQGAATTCYVATHPALKRVTGQYFDNCQAVLAQDKRIYDESLSGKLWAVSEALTGAYLSKKDVA